MPENPREEIRGTVAEAARQFQNGAFAEARKSVERILATTPQYIDALNLLGGILRQLGDLPGALAALDRAIRVTPVNASLQRNRANLLLELGRPGDAADGAEESIRIQPDHAYGWFLRAVALERLERHADALTSYEKSLQLNPGVPAAIAGAGTCLANLGFHLEALIAYDAALRLAPGDAATQMHRGVALFELDRLDEALPALDAVMEQRPGAETAANRGLVLLALARGDEARAAFDLAISLAQDWPARGMASLRYQRGLISLYLHDFRQGWSGYEYRWTAGLVDPPPLDRGEPAWRGDQIHGTLRIWREQPIGDEVLFSRLVPLAAARAGRTVLECSPRLAPLFARSFPQVDVRAQGEVAGRADAQVSIASLGVMLGADPASLNAGLPFLKPDPARTALLRARYQGLAHGRPIVGISWYSSNRRTGGQKSAPLEDWELLLRQDYLFVNLQYGEAAGDAPAAQARFGCTIYSDPEVDQMKDLDAFTAQVAAMDGIVSVSNTTVHFAGALGVPTVVMVAPARARLWYWGLELDTTPWYACVRVSRRHRGQSWSQHVGMAAADLGVLLRATC